MSKKLLVIGAGLAQVDAIIRAQEIGYFILASDGSPDAVGLRHADKSRIIDVKDVRANLDWAREEKIDGVISYAMDVALPTVLAIRETLELPGLGRLPMEVSRDKSQQRKRFKKAGLSQPAFEVVDNDRDAERAARKLGFPLVIKPVDNSGSRGVTVIKDASQLSEAYLTALQHIVKGQIILEQYIQGTELTVEGLSIKGEHHILAISDKFKPEGPYRVATQLAYPAAITPLQEKQVIALIRGALDAAEVDNTPTHSEVILTLDDPQLVEIGCRGGGFYVFTRVVEATSGYDIVGNWTRMCAGDPAEDVRIVKKGVVLRFYTATPGKLVSVEGLENAQLCEGVETDLFLKQGDAIPELKTDGSRTGWMIVRGKDRAHAVAQADRVSAMVKFNTEPL
jgi:biotin carboxylase